MNEPCVVHANNFRLFADLHKRFDEKEQQEIFRIANEHVHDRHMIRVLLHEHATRGRRNDGPQTTEDGKKRRKVYKLLDSSSRKSIAHFYEEALIYLKQHGNECAITNDLLYHVSGEVQTNYTNGDDEDFRTDEYNFNPVARHVDEKFFSIEHANTMFSVYEASRPIEVSFRITLSHPRRNANNGNDNGDNHRRERNLLIDYLTHPAHRTAVKLLDFVFLDARECWALWNDVMDRAISVHREKRLFPIKDSLYHITVLYEPVGRTIFPHHTHGLVTKVGLLVDFVLSFRVLMQHSIIACCYAIKREATHRTHYTKKHDCHFPATSQGVYQELFLTSKYGHDLVCNLNVDGRESALHWLRLYQETRELMLEKKKIDAFTDKLQHLLHDFTDHGYGVHKFS